MCSFSKKRLVLLDFYCTFFKNKMHLLANKRHFAEINGYSKRQINLFRYVLTPFGSSLSYQPAEQKFPGTAAV